MWPPVDRIDRSRADRLIELPVLVSTRYRADRVAHSARNLNTFWSSKCTWLARSTGANPGAEEQHVVQLLRVERPDSSPVRRGKLSSDAPGRAGSAAAAGAPSRRAWPTAAAAEVGAGSGALPRGAAPAGCWAARAGLAKITRSTAFRVAWGMQHGDPVRPTNFGPPFRCALCAECGLMSRAPRRSAAARRRAVREGRPSVTPCPPGRRSGRGAPPGGPPSARSTPEPPISPPPPPSEPGGPAPSTPAVGSCRRNGCRYAGSRPKEEMRGLGSWIEFHHSRKLPPSDRGAHRLFWSRFTHTPRNPPSSLTLAEIFAGRANALEGCGAAPVP